MEPNTSSIISNLMGVLMPFIAKGAKEFISIAGEAAYDKANGLMASLKERLSGDEEAISALERLGQKPDRYEGLVREILVEKFSEDENLAIEIQRILDKFGLEIGIVQKMRTGKGVIGLDASKVANGTVRVVQEIEQAEDVTGARIERIGE